MTQVLENHFVLAPRDSDNINQKTVNNVSFSIVKNAFSRKIFFTTQPSSQKF